MVSWTKIWKWSKLHKNSTIGWFKVTSYFMETTSKSWPAGPKPRVGRKCSEHVFKPWTKVLGYCTLKENSRDEGLALEVPLQGVNVTSRELINKACKERKNPSTRWLVFLHIGRLLQSRGSTNMNFPWHRFIFYMGSFWPLTRFTISTKLTHEFVDFIIHHMILLPHKIWTQMLIGRSMPTWGVWEGPFDVVSLDYTCAKSR